MFLAFFRFYHSYLMRAKPFLFKKGCINHNEM
ncbi:hypothetical protein HP2RS_04072 [Helicobacter pylori]|nr:hypothetical protein HP2RS_04072 [Helicobacter pylori]